MCSKPVSLLPPYQLAHLITGHSSLVGFSEVGSQDAAENEVNDSFFEHFKGGGDSELLTAHTFSSFLAN